MSRFNEMTKYPKLYIKTYWGTPKYELPRDSDMSLIFDNRNKFADNFKLKTVLDKENPKIRFLLNYNFNNDLEDNNLLEIIKKYVYMTPYEIFKKLNVLHGSLDCKCEYYDHVEVYKTTDSKIIILSSPYRRKDKEYYDFLSKNNFIDTELLYNTSTVSFYKIYNENEVNEIKQKLINKIRENKNNLIKNNLTKKF
jgi:hypothetical protein